MNRHVLYLEKRIPARNQKRFYTITVTPTLFGSWAMVREWGRIGQPGTVRAGDGVRDGRRGLGGGRAVASAEGETGLSGYRQVRGGGCAITGIAKKPRSPLCLGRAIGTRDMFS